MISVCKKFGIVRIYRNYEFEFMKIRPIEIYKDAFLQVPTLPNTHCPVIYQQIRKLVQRFIVSSQALKICSLSFLFCLIFVIYMFSLF